MLQIDGESGIKYSAKEMYNGIVRLAYLLQKLNIKEGDVVGICSENRYEFVLTMFATFCLNATVAPLNITYTESMEMLSFISN